MLLEKRLAGRIDRIEARNDIGLDQKPAEQLLDARSVCLFALKRCELMRHLHVGMMQADQPFAWKHAAGKESGLEDRPFALIEVVRDQQHKAIRALQACLDRVEPIPAQFDLHGVQKNLDLVGAEPLEGFSEKLSDIRMLGALVAQEDPKFSCGGLEGLLGRLHEGFGVDRSLAAQTGDAIPQPPLVVRMRHERPDLRMGQDILQLLGLKRDEGNGGVRQTF